jgi:beta-fructofuranosidase
MTEEFFANPSETRRQMATDPNRPVYHFLPPRNWMNDPNGLFFWQGKTHLFYQFNPNGAAWGSIHWGHASSEDLLHWQDHPIALTPEPGAGDDQGCFSGCLVEDHGVPTAIYTGFINPADTPVLIAQAQDADLIGWQKSHHNPVITQQPEGVNPTDFRDPYVWAEGHHWKMVIGAGLQDGDSAALLYQSDDLLAWEYLGHLLKGRTLESVTMWECPNFFQLGDKYVLLVSLFPDIQGVYYYVGLYDGQAFTPQTEGFLDRGPIFYAPQVRPLEDNKAIMFGWLLEGRSDAATIKAGWAGVQSLPRELALDEKDHLVSRPIPNLASLRKRGHTFRNLILEPGEIRSLDVQGKQLEIEMCIESLEGTLGLGVLTSCAREEMTWINYDSRQGVAVLDTTQSSLSAEAQTGTQSVSFQANPLAPFKIHAFIDGSVIEVWFDDRVAISGRVYPTLQDSQGVCLRLEGTAVRVLSLNVWEMDAIWPMGTKE